MAKRVEGIYYNTADMPVFLEDRHIGGHDYVYLEGYLRIPGHFVEIQDPQNDPDAPESFRIAYARMLEQGEAQKTETHANTSTRKHNIVPVSEEEEIPKPIKPRAPRKGKRESATEESSSQ